MVLFVEPKSTALERVGSIVREMPLNERGELVKAWPGGFFEEATRKITRSPISANGTPDQYPLGY